MLGIIAVVFAVCFAGYFAAGMTDVMFEDGAPWPLLVVVFILGSLGGMSLLGLFGV